MFVDLMLRFVEDRNSSRNSWPATRPLGIRLQSAGTTVGGAGTTRNTADRPYAECAQAVERSTAIFAAVKCAVANGPKGGMIQDMP